MGSASANAESSTTDTDLPFWPRAGWMDVSGWPAGRSWLQGWPRGGGGGGGGRHSPWRRLVRRPRPRSHETDTCRINSARWATGLDWRSHAERLLAVACICPASRDTNSFLPLFPRIIESRLKDMSISRLKRLSWINVALEDASLSYTTYS